MWSKRRFDVPLKEAIVTFLIIIGHRLSNKMIQERFRHSSEFVFRWFDIILNVIVLWLKIFVKPSDPQFREVPNKSRTDMELKPYDDDQKLLPPNEERSKVDSLDKEDGSHHAK